MIQLWPPSKRPQWNVSWSTNTTLKTQETSQSTWATTLTWKKFLQCIWTLWSTSRTISIQPYRSEDHAERVFAAHVRWTAMDCTLWPASGKLTRTFQSHHLLHLWDTCLCWRIWLLTWQTSTPSTGPSNRTWRERSLRPQGYISF